MRYFLLIFENAHSCVFLLLSDTHVYGILPDISIRRLGNKSDCRIEFSIHVSIVGCTVVQLSIY